MTNSTPQAMPERSGLDMPTQSLDIWRKDQVRPKVASHLWHIPYLERSVVFGGAFALTIYGGWQMFRVIDVGTITSLQWVLLVLFVINFSWIALACTSAILGFLKLISRRKLAALPSKLSSRTAVVMPIYNESPARVFGAMLAMYNALQDLGYGYAFDFILLSDTTNPDVWMAEQKTFLHIRSTLPAETRFYYRHRPKNTAKKAGNIAEFVTNYGGNYAHMLVLDADSAMDAETIVRLAAAMEKDPDAGIIQTLPLIVNRNTFFARLQQFAARVYGPIIAEGLSAWMGRDGNYWGHNAIIRMRAFSSAAGLPELPGKPPFGGHILSHDFIEAALIRRAGFSVYMLPELEGSYEESPPSLLDIAARDRRWCQGNLQHARVLGAKGLTLPTRQHIATGIFAYLASPFWLMQILVGFVLALQAQLIRPEYFSRQFSLLPTWPRFDAELAIQLFLVTMTVLLTPKALGLLWAILNTHMRRGCGGGIRLIASALMEVIVSALLAPTMMLIQTGAVLGILLGRDAGWQPQRRDDGSVPLRDIARRHRWHTVLGLFMAISALSISPYLFAWMSPTVVGLLLSIGLSAITASLSVGLWLKKKGLLRTPEETTPPASVLSCNQMAQTLEKEQLEDQEAITAYAACPSLQAFHEATLPTSPHRTRGHISAERAVAEAKLSEAETLSEASNWLTNKEKMIVLHDRALLTMLLMLKTETKPQPL